VAVAARSKKPKERRLGGEDVIEFTKH